MAIAIVTLLLTLQSILTAQPVRVEVGSKFISPDPAEDDWFGCPGISGDIAIIGEVADDQYGNNAGVAHIFSRTLQGDWLPTGDKLWSPSPQAGDLWGSDVSIRNGYALIGAWFDNVSGIHNAGSVTKFKQSGSDWMRSDTFITAFDAEAGDNFGVGVALMGNYVMIGSMCDDDAGEDTGSVYIYERQPDDTWTYITKFQAPDPHEGDNFGSDVAWRSDFLTVVGAWKDNTLDGEDIGSAYILQHEAGEWNLVQKLVAYDGRPYETFGEAVAISEQEDAVVVGAHRAEVDGKRQAGAVYVYRPDDRGVWRETHKIVAADGQAWDNFGVRLSLDGDTLLIGAFGDNENQLIACGSVYYMTLPPPVALNPPGNLSCEAVSNSRVQLNWTDTNTDPNEAAVVIQRMPYSGSWVSWQTIATLPADSTSHLDTDSLYGEVRYTYRVGACEE